MAKSKTFYYRFDWVNAWFIFNSSFLITMLYGSFKCPCLLYWPQTQVLWGTCLFSIAVWAWKYLLKHRLAVFDGKEITIDTCKPLRWKDIDYAEEKIVRCCFKKRRIIILHPKEGLKYEYNFLQKHNGEFTPFSIPLYEVVTKEDAAEMAALIAKKVKLVRPEE